MKPNKFTTTSCNNCNGVFITLESLQDHIKNGCYKLKCHRCEKEVKQLVDIGCSCGGPKERGCLICWDCERKVNWDKRHQHDLNLF